MLSGKNCTSYKGGNLGGFSEISQEHFGVQRPALHADRYYGGAGAGSQKFMTFRIGAAWERGKVYGFLLCFHAVHFVLALLSAAKRM